MPKKQKETKRKRKDPRKPKRTKSAYNCFVAERRPGLKREHPDMGFADLSRLMGDEWRGMSEVKRKKYVQMSEQDRQRHDKEMAQYVRSRGSSSSDSDAPRRRRTPVFFRRRNNAAAGPRAMQR